MTLHKITTYSNDAKLALSLLSRTPISVEDGAYQRAAKAVWAYGLVGVVWGALVWAVGLCAVALNIPDGLAALIALGSGLIFTGALHEDGLADCADGLWGANEKQRRLEIMKDSQIGSYGTLALVVSVLLRWQLIKELMLAEFAFAGLIVTAVLARASMPLLMVYLPHARSSGLSHSVGRPQPKYALIGVGIAAVIALSFAGLIGLAALLCAGCAALLCSTIAQRKVSGQTGDILGATEQVSEIFVLLAIVALLP